ncbi:19695_t:CDS:2 [Entrophospora sp. SA101]|nr:19695_t:CDS:2 [Entrophospora sp. SA101]CAJ0839113.1 12839_t:CDS:2 [Entrophospora sp. SA101]CAJ0842362.1 15290_t:CDS:2 [Entrophospora sp. SA101]
MTDIASKLSGIKHIILVLSGKGGVGKSSVTTQLALCLVQNGGHKVGILDIDLTGPSMPHMLGLDDKQVHQASNGWVPVYADENQKLCCMSIGFLLQNKNDSIVWRGPKKNAMIKQFLSDVTWGNLDYLIIDTPPGTSDEHISIVEYLKDVNPDGAVIVTTPQLPILGVIENMSGFVCPHCEECTNLFSTGGGESLAQEFDVEFLGRVPIDPSLTLMVENSYNDNIENGLIKEYPSSNLFKVFINITNKLVEKVTN